MGFKKNNVNIEKLGIQVPEAYAQISNLNVRLDGSCFAAFKIQTTRENMEKPDLETIHMNLKIDKDLPIYRQVYEFAKTKDFEDWEDDIVDPEDNAVDE